MLDCYLLKSIDASLLLHLLATINALSQILVVYRSLFFISHLDSGDIANIFEIVIPPGGGVVIVLVGNSVFESGV